MSFTSLFFRRCYNFYRLVIITLKGVGFLIFSKNFTFYKKIIHDIKVELALQNQTLSKAQRKRFFTYSVVGVVMFSAALRTLTGKKLRKQQQEISQLFTLLTPIIDDLFDEFAYSVEEIKAVARQEPQRTDNAWEKIAIKMVQRIETLNPFAAHHPLVEKIIDYQAKSQAQEKGNLPEQELREIIYHKGGISVQLNYDVITGAPSTVLEEECFFGLGVIIQLTNDIFDIFKDRNNQLQTLVTDCTDIRLLRNEYNSVVENTFEKIKQLPYSQENIHDFLLQMMVLVSRGRVALDHLEEAQRTTNHIFQPQSYSRQQLITDMEKIKILWKSILYNLDL
jgi:hypothetical protein